MARQQNLFCAEAMTAPVLRKAYVDPKLIQDNRVMATMLKLEDMYIPDSYFTNGSKKEIKPFMRKIVATWMFEVTYLLTYVLLTCSKCTHAIER